MKDINLLIHGIAISQLLSICILPFFEKKKSLSRNLLTLVSLCMIMLLLKPLFVLMKLSTFFYLSVFLSGLLPYLCYLFSESLFDDHSRQLVSIMLGYQLLFPPHILHIY